LPLAAPCLSPLPRRQALLPTPTVSIAGATGAYRPSPLMELLEVYFFLVTQS
jgi:hypothetical protein